MSIEVRGLSSETSDLEGFITHTPGLLEVHPPVDFDADGKIGLEKHILIKK